MVRATFEISEAVANAAIAELGSHAFRTRELSLGRGYENKLLIGIDVDEREVGLHLLNSAQIDPSALPTWTDLRSLATDLERRGAQQAQAVADAQTTANALPDPDEKNKRLAEAQLLAETNAAQQLRGLLNNINERGLLMYVWDKYVKAAVPQFLYFSEYYQMQGHVNIEQLRARQSNNSLLDSDRPMLGLIELARLNLDQLLTPNRTEALINKIEGASNHLSRQVLKYWSQNKHLSVRFDVRPALPNDPDGMRTGTNLWGRVVDSVHQVSTLIGTRSKGFVWFFSFLAWFSQQRKRPEPLILLLDEPGLSLHGSAQADLLRYIEEELKPHHQVIYTTHSPFLVDAQHFGRVRIVEDRSMDRDEFVPVEEGGTKVTQDVLEVRQGSLFPLQGALGYEIAQTLFVGPNNLIVEGVSDLLYIQTISAVLDGKGAGLSAKWTITPVGGADKIPTFVALLGAQQTLRLATLIDIQGKDRQRIEQLYKTRLLAKKNVLTFADFTAKVEADIEDMFDVAFYLELVNGEYGSALSSPILEADLPAPGARIVVRVQAWFKAHESSGPTFNHYRPARYFAENTAKLTPKISVDTLGRFEAAFHALNGLLPKKS